jgi:predicted short-subunit dehydrogenase-like oxidoreductase (DUF2520 family)
VDAFAAAGRHARLVPARSGFDPPPAEALVFLAVPDDAVAAMASSLGTAALPAGIAVAHVSGALGLDALDALRAGHDVGSFHPLQSFPAPRSPVAFRGATVAVDASTPALLKDLTALARAIGAKPVHVDGGQRALYHAAAVFASNYVVAVVAEGMRVLRAAGWEEADAATALIPLVEGVVASLREQGPTKALTGPIRRGDAATVTRHIKALRRVGGRPKPEALYRMLGEAALEIAREAGLHPAAARSVQRALTGKTAATRRRSRA